MSKLSLSVVYELGQCMRKSGCSRNDSNPVHLPCADVGARIMHSLSVRALDEHQNQHECIEFESFLKQQDSY